MARRGRGMCEQELGLKILAKYITTAVTGVAPRVMGIGPRYAIPLVLDMVGITKEDVDLYEVSTFFAHISAVLHSSTLL